MDHLGNSRSWYSCGCYNVTQTIRPNTLADQAHKLQWPQHTLMTLSPSAGQCVLPHHKNWTTCPPSSPRTNLVVRPWDVNEKWQSTDGPSWLRLGSCLWGLSLLSSMRMLLADPLNPVGCKVGPPRSGISPACPNLVNALSSLPLLCSWVFFVMRLGALTWWGAVATRGDYFVWNNV